MLDEIGERKREEEEAVGRKDARGELGGLKKEMGREGRNQLERLSGREEQRQSLDDSSSSYFQSWRKSGKKGRVDRSRVSSLRSEVRGSILSSFGLLLPTTTLPRSLQLVWTRSELRLVGT